MLRVTAAIERVRSSLFYVPMLFIVAGVVLGQVGIFLDGEIARGVAQIPLGLTSTVESARVVLSTIASATITVAGIAFSVSLLIIQLASSQYSPRVIHGLFRDPFNKRVMGVVVGTFTYCLIVLRAVRSPLDEGGIPVVPSLSVVVAVVLGIVAILSIVAFINHSAHSMDVSQILQSVTDEAISHAHRLWPERDQGAGDTRLDDAGSDAPSGQGHLVPAPRNGWVQQIDREKVMAAVPHGSTVRIDVGVGGYTIRGARLATVWPAPPDGDAVDGAIHDAFGIGTTRTMSQDAAYGVRQLADVALKALSPGVNDPTTAQDAIVHLGAVLAVLLTRDPPRREVRDDEARRLLLPDGATHEDVVDLAFDEVRRAASTMPAVCIYLLQVLGTLVDVLCNTGLEERTDPLRAQAGLVLAAAADAGMQPMDFAAVRDAHDRRFES